MRLLIINGPNMNMLGIREPDIYGTKTYRDLCKMIESHAQKLHIDCECFQSNFEGEIVTKIQQAFFDKVDGIVINPAAYTHTSIAILDALMFSNIPTVEVHISNIHEREGFRQTSYISQYCEKIIQGHGLNGYLEAMDILVSLAKCSRHAAQTESKIETAQAEGKPSASQAEGKIAAAQARDRSSTVHNNSSLQ